MPKWIPISYPYTFAVNEFIEAFEDDFKHIALPVKVINVTIFTVALCGWLFKKRARNRAKAEKNSGSRKFPAR